MSDFELHERLTADSLFLGRSRLCQLRLMNDENYPWVLLIPERAGISEVFQLPESDQQCLQRESVAVGRALMDAFDGEKLNVAALGNMVPQLHIHHVVRFSTDPAWPAPVWGAVPSQPYSQQELAGVLERLRPVVTALEKA